MLPPFDELGGRHIVVRVFSRHLRPLHQAFGARQCRDAGLFLQHAHRRAGLAGVAGHGRPFIPAGCRPSLVTDPLTWRQHLQLLLKSAIVAVSWIGTYYALKHLPLSLGAPIRATSPLLTLFGAIVFLGERPTWLETVGVLTTLASFVGLSLGRREGGRAFSPQQMVLVPPWRQRVWRGQRAVRQISAGHAAFLRAHGAMLVFRSIWSCCSRRSRSAGSCGCGRATNSPGAGASRSSRCRCWWRITPISGRCAIPTRWWPS